MPSRAEKYRAKTSLLTGGGSAINAAVAIAQLGGNSEIVSVVGDDEFATLIEEFCAREAVGTKYLQKDSSIKTPHSAVILDHEGERLIVNYRDNFNTRERPELDENTSALLVDTRSPKFAMPYVEWAKDHSIPVIADGEAPIAPARELLMASDYVAFSEQGLTDFSPDRDAREALIHAYQELKGYICVTRGARPTLLYDGKVFKEIDVPKVVAFNTLGAGDAWHGAFALFLAEGLSPEEAIRRANIAASVRVTSLIGRMPSRQELENILR